MHPIWIDSPTQDRSEALQNGVQMSMDEISVLGTVRISCHVNENIDLKFFDLFSKKLKKVTGSFEK